MVQGTVYRGSNDQYYGDVDVWERFEAGIWTPCCWDTDSGEEWIQSENDDLIHLKPIPRRELPVDCRTKRAESGLRVLSRVVERGTP